MKRALIAAALLPLIATPGLSQEAGVAVSATARASGAPAEPVPSEPVFTEATPVVTGTVPGLGGADPWSGIVIVVNPPPEDVAPTTVEPSQALIPTDQPQDGDAAVASGPPQSLDLLPGDETEEDATAEMPSLWTALELGIGDGIETLPPRQTAVVPTRPVKATPSQPLPTSFDLRQGRAQFAVVTSVTTTPAVSSVLDGSAGGGSGEVKGRLGYVLDNWSLYSVGGVGAAESTGTVSLYDSLLVGGTYTVPLAPFGMGTSDTLGAKVEVGDTQATTTSLEMRSGQGNYQRFISVERSTAPTATPSDTVRAGVVGKF
ncbi:MAG: hypothetical protein K0R27_2161 [Xanthobacteraceae bacterium]|jgi:hypothetical protein|nr:hypothetical protein [Xanthobacteraceae bacterium]